MIRFAFVAFFVASTAVAQTLSDPTPLTVAPARTPSFHDTTDIVAARARDGFVVVWTEGSVLRMKRLSSRGDVIGEAAMEGDFAPVCAATNGDETLVSISRHDSSSNFIRIHADGRMTVAPPDTRDSAPSQLVPFGDGYLGARNPLNGSEILLLDRDGRVLARKATRLRNLPALVTTNDRTLLLTVDGNVLHASTIAPDLSIANDVVLSTEIASVGVSATADRPGEVAVAANTSTGLAVLFFDSSLRPSDRIALPAPPLYVSMPMIASDGNGYVVALRSRDVIVTKIDAQRRLETTSVPSVLGIPPPPVSGVDGALLALGPSLPPRAHFLIVGGSEAAPAPRLLADAEPDQRWPRIARIGERVVIVWDESRGTERALMAAIFDPKRHRIMAGPVEVARDGIGLLGDELAVATNGQTIAVSWAAGSDHLFLLSPNLQTLASPALGSFPFAFDEHPHDVAWTGSQYLLAQGTTRVEVSRWDANLKRLGDSTILGLDAVSGYTYSDARLSLATSDALVLANNWYQLLCWCGEGPWHVALGRFSPYEDVPYWPHVFATRSVAGIKRKMSGFARSGDRLLLFFPQNTEVRSAATLDLLSTIPNDAALTQELPLGSIGQAAVNGNEIVATLGNTLEFFNLDGMPIRTLPLDDTANDSQFAAGDPFVIVNDAVTSSGSRRINIRLLDFTPPHRRTAAQ